MANLRLWLFCSAGSAQHPCPFALWGMQARLDSLGSEVEQRRERLIAIAEQQVLQASAGPQELVCLHFSAVSACSKALAQESEALGGGAIPASWQTRMRVPSLPPPCSPLPCRQTSVPAPTC